MNFLTLLLIDWDEWKPENLFGSQVLERTPAGLTIFYLIAVGILIGFLIITFFDQIRRPKFIFERNLPAEVRRKLAQTVANRSIFVWQIFFVAIALAVFGFQVYWVYFADESNDQFQALNYKDLRNRRATAASLRGWMLDRSGNLASALAYYKLDKDGDIERGFALEREMAHLLGTERGTPGLERSLYKKQIDPMPEAWEVLTRIKKPRDEQKDVRVTMDRDLQAFIAKELDGKKGAIVVLNPQTGDLLAMYSNPSFSLAEAQSLEDYLRLEGNKRDKPLLNRATREFYVPGSTFKTFTLISAFRAGKQNSVFPSYADGFRPTRGSRPIVDATQKLQDDGTVTGACDGGCQEKDITFAYKVSSNQYFAQLAIELGRERLRETAQIAGIAAADSPEDALMQRFFPHIWNTSNPNIANALAPQQSSMVTGKDISLYDLGIQGMGQGYAGQMTPFQMALIASIPANMEGKLIKPRIEADQPPQLFSQVLSPQQAAAIRNIMSTVTEEPGGTGTVISAKLAGTGIKTGGKTGTAEKLAPEYDAKGALKTVTRRRKNANGEWEEYKVPQMYERTDSWFITIAPLERPQLAIAVVVEGGGFGARTAAPIAANVILKARDLGLLGEQYKPKAPAPKTPAKKKTREVKIRTSSHFFILALIVFATAAAHYSVHYGALIRGYETSGMTAVRNIVLLSLLAFLPVVLKRFVKYEGNWTIYTTAVLLFSIGLTVQYRLFSDPEYTSRKDKAEARQQKLKTLQLHYIQENYSAEKKQMMGLPATPPSPVDLSAETPRPAPETMSEILFSGKTVNPLLGIIGLIIVFILLRRNDVLELLQKNGFLIVMLTLGPLFVAAIWSRGGKFGGNLTPWELAKIPFLVGFAAILAVLYKNLAKTYWGVPRAKDVLPLVFMAILPFLPFFVLKDFGQMMVFSSVYATLYLIAVRRFAQRFVLVGSVLLVAAILVVGALPLKTQERIPLLPTLATPVRAILPDRIQQRFHLWLDGFNPPTPETSWWKEDYDDYYKKLVERDPSLPQMLAEDPDLQRTINTDAWFDVLAFQPAQATFGLASGGTTGRGLGLGYPELIPVADSDYIFAALAEELGLLGGLLLTFALIVFVSAGVRTARDSRDMFSKLCSIGLAAFIGFQALVNIGGITRALPMTGITLPFVSHGGFSLITSFIMLGMLMAFSHRNSVDRQRDEIEVTL